MDLVAIVMVLSAAVVHALWNALAKQSDDILAYLWSICVAALVIYAIPFAVLATREELEWDWLRFALLSGLLHVGYFTLLARAYQTADLSFAYPIARGTGLTLVPILAVPIFDERPTLAAWLGIALVCAGILGLHRPILIAALNRGNVRGLISIPAFLTGLTIAAYSLNDAAGVHRANPVVYLYIVYAICSALLAPYLLRRRPEAARRALRLSMPLIVGGAGSFGTYFIVLAATRLAPVSYVVPMRETSIVIGAILGARMLGESLGWTRISACILVVLGVVAIGAGG
jgi:drug/metabolite transporter (DMT)-like permease